MPGDLPAGDVAASGGMTLFGTIGMSSHLRPDGSVWINDTVDWMAEPLQWRWRRAGIREALGCILVATKRVPELRALLPVKPPEAPPCPACAGGGHLTRDGASIEGVWCDSCYGLGWLVPEGDDQVRAPSN